MFDDFMEWQIFSIFWGNQLLFDSSNICIILDVFIAKGRADVSGCTCFSYASRTIHHNVFCAFQNLLFKREIQLDVLSFLGL